MKIIFPHSQRKSAAEQGSAVIVILAFLSIMVILVAANTKTVNWLRAEVRLMDQRQTERLAASATNQVSVPTSLNQPTP
jgi:hypothetical protein